MIFQFDVWSFEISFLVLSGTAINTELWLIQIVSQYTQQSLHFLQLFFNDTKWEKSLGRTLFVKHLNLYHLQTTWPQNAVVTDFPGW